MSSVVTVELNLYKFSDHLIVFDENVFEIKLSMAKYFSI